MDVSSGENGAVRARVLMCLWVLGIQRWTMSMVSKHGVQDSPVDWESYLSVCDILEMR